MLCISQTLLGNECCLWIITRQLLEVIRSSPLAELYVLLVFLWLGVYYPTPDLEQYSPYYLTSIQGEKKKTKNKTLQNLSNSSMSSQGGVYPCWNKELQRMRLHLSPYIQSLPLNVEVQYLYLFWGSRNFYNYFSQHPPAQRVVMCTFSLSSFNLRAICVLSCLRF